MLSVLIITNLLRACKENKVKSIFLFEAFVHILKKISKTDPNIEGLREQDAYPAMPEDGYGWENYYLAKECVGIFMKIMVLRRE